MRAFDWLFRDRRTGEVVIAQLPNPPLVVFLVAAAVGRFGGLEGAAATTVSVVATVALLWWAADEVLRGVNPFRRVLGGAVALATVLGLLLR